MKLLQKLKTDKMSITGFLLCLLSFSIFLLIKNADAKPGFILDDGGGGVFLNYALAFVYLFIAVISTYSKNGLNVFKLKKEHYNYALTLFCISAFSLNLSFNIFDEFTTWTNYYLIIMFVPLLITPLIPALPAWVNAVLNFIRGAGVVMALYFSVFLVPLWPVSFLIAFVLGISLHTFAPVLLLINYIHEFLKGERYGRDNAAFAVGILLPLVVVVFFSLQWKKAHREIHEAHASLITDQDQDLPEWIKLSQQLSHDPITEKIIQGDLMYNVGNKRRDFWGFPNNSFGEYKKHDPLVYMGFAMMGELNISKENRIKILKSRYDKRHLAHRKLWTGENLQTSQVLTNIEIFPEYRLAYSEKVINIKNTSKRFWRTQQEAVYTFHLPEGSVATSMSLWVNGEERKSRLTTKEKADSAYVSIVGVEKRDPALMHWQEGNRISVTVFPCTPEEERVFKIGVTTPLHYENGELSLENIYFEGPQVRNALETTVIRFQNEKVPVNLNLPDDFEVFGAAKFRRTDEYRNSWKLSFQAPELSTASFSFNGANYKLKKLNYGTEDFSPEVIYLDLNEKWEEKEIAEIIKAAGKRKVYVYNDGFIELDYEYFHIPVRSLLKKRFSCFPWYKIESPENTLVITHSTDLGPNLSDLESTLYSDKLMTYLSSVESNTRVFVLDDELSDYMKSLHEFNVIKVNFGSIREATEQIKNNTFKSPDIGKHSVALHNAKVEIIRDSSETVKSVAPNHLLRMYGYKKLLQTAGRTFYNQSEMELEKMVAVANEAYIVSPVSSLVVLETQEDYERFGIDENKNSLGNAAVGNSGAVPEPQEWLLIGVLTLSLFIKFYRR